MNAPMSYDEFCEAFFAARASIPAEHDQRHLTTSLVFALAARLETADGGPQLLADALADVVAAELRTRPGGES